jgi:hypothetical protein
MKMHRRSELACGKVARIHPSKRVIGMFAIKMRPALDANYHRSNTVDPTRNLALHNLHTFTKINSAWDVGCPVSVLAIIAMTETLRQRLAD